MEETFSIKVEENSSYTLCMVYGSVLSSSFKVFQDTLKESLHKKNEVKKYFVVDYSQVTMFTSTCINVIISLNEDIDKGNWELIIISPRLDISDLLDVTGFSRIHPVYNSFHAFLEDKGINL